MPKLKGNLSQEEIDNLHELDLNKRGRIDILPEKSRRSPSVKQIVTKKNLSRAESNIRNDS